MVVRDPHKRLTARACLEHAWFKMDTLALSTHLLGESAVRISNLQVRACACVRVRVLFDATCCVA
jgi:hypothetical protein